MLEPRPVTELRSILVPRIFMELSLSLKASVNKAIKVHDFLCSENPSGFQPALLNTVKDGPALMALQIYDVVYNDADPPLWFKNFTAGIELPF